MSASSHPHVLLVDSGRGWRGGQRQVLFLLQGLHENDIEAGLVAPANGELFKRAAEFSDRLFGVNISGGADVASALIVRRLIKQRRFDIVHAHDSHSHSVAAIATVGMRAEVSVVVSRRVATVVGKNWPSAIKYHHGADMFLAISSGVKKALSIGGVSEEMIRIVPSGIDLVRCAEVRPASDVRRHIGVDQSAFLIGNVAAMTEEKGHASLMHAAHKVLETHPDVHFVIAGDGPLRTDIESLSEKLGIVDRVSFLGHRDDALDILGSCDVFVMPSLSEGLGSSIMDAHALGVSVVASNVGGIPDIVEDGVTGLLVDVGDVEALSSAIERLVVDTGLRDKLIEAGKAQSLRYDYRRMVYNTIEAYRSLQVGRKRQNYGE